MKKIEANSLIDGWSEPMGLSWKGFKHLALMLSLLSLSTSSYSQLGEREQQEVRSDIQRALEALKANDPDTAVREFLGGSAS